jgi:ankyrin repeat protein
MDRNSFSKTHGLMMISGTKDDVIIDEVLEAGGIQFKIEEGTAPYQLGTIPLTLPPITHRYIFVLKHLEPSGSYSLSVRPELDGAKGNMAFEDLPLRYIAKDRQLVGEGKGTIQAETVTVKAVIKLGEPAEGHSWLITGYDSSGTEKDKYSIKFSPKKTSAQPKTDSANPLLSAMKNGEAVRVNALLDAKADPKVADAQGDTALMTAAGTGDVKTSQLLLSKRANPNAANSRRRTALMAAAEHGQLAVVDVLLANGADVKARDADGKTATDYALESANQDTIAFLIGRGGTFNTKSLSAARALVNAIFKNDDLVSLLLRQGVDPESKDSNGESALAQAVRRLVEWNRVVDEAHRRSTSVIGLLLDNGASPDSRDEEGATPLTRSIGARQFELAELLLEKGANPNLPDSKGWLPLIAGVWSGQEHLIRLLVKKGADRGARDPLGRTALSSVVTTFEDDDSREDPARRRECSERVRLLLELGADPNARDADGHTPLSWAVAKCKREEGRSAARGCNPEAVRLLLSKGADANAKGPDDLPPLLTTDQHDIARLLLENGADPNSRDPLGNTALWYAAEHCEDGLVKVLVDSGADANSRKAALEYLRTKRSFCKSTIRLISASKRN